MKQICIVCFVLLGAALTIAGCSDDKTATPTALIQIITNTTPTPTFYQCQQLIGQPDYSDFINSLPSYPGSTIIQDVYSGPARKIYIFATKDGWSSVPLFYQKHLNTNYGQLFSSTGNNGNAYYKVSDKHHALLMKFALSESVNGPLGTSIEADLSVIPDFERVPLYPGSENAQTQSLKPSKGDNANCVTTFTVKANTTDVQKYYKDAMERYGWQSESISNLATMLPDENYTNALSFSYSLTYNECGEIAYMHLTSHDLANGVVGVELRVHGHINRVTGETSCAYY